MEDYWEVVRDIGRECGCVRIEMLLMGRMFAEDRGEAGSQMRSSIVIPIERGGEIIFRCPPQLSVRHAVAISAVMDILPQAFARRLASPPADVRSVEYVASGRISPYINR